MSQVAHLSIPSHLVLFSLVILVWILMYWYGFQITELFVNITTHVAVPKHEILTTEEKEQLLKKYELDDNKVTYSLLIHSATKK